MLIHFNCLQLDDIQSIITKFLEHDYYENIDLFINSLKDEPTFKPFGEMIKLVKIQHEGKINAI